MNYKISGVSSFLLLFIALGISSYVLFAFSIMLGIVYVVAIPIALLVTFYHYCRKCPHLNNNTCRHVFVGPIVLKLFMQVSPSKYTVREIIFALLPLTAIIIFPQYWLIKNIKLFIAHWVIMVFAVAIVRVGVCTKCKNLNCLLCSSNKDCKDCST